MFKKLLLGTALGLAMMIFAFSPKVVKAEVFNYESLTADSIDYSALHDEYLSGEVDYDAIAATISECNNDNIDYDAFVVALGGEVVGHDPAKPVEFTSDKEAFLSFLEDSKELDELVENSVCYYIDDDGNMVEYTDDTWNDFLEEGEVSDEFGIDPGKSIKKSLNNAVPFSTSKTRYFYRRFKQGKNNVATIELKVDYDIEYENRKRFIASATANVSDYDMADNYEWTTNSLSCEISKSRTTAHAVAKGKLYKIYTRLGKDYKRAIKVTISGTVS